MAWGTGKQRASRSRTATVAMLALASLATAVGATGLRSFTEAMTADRDALPRFVEVFLPAEQPATPILAVAAAPSAPAVDAPIAFVAAPSSATRSPIAVAVVAPSLRPAALQSTPSAGVALPSNRSASITSFVPASPTFTLATPIESQRGLVASGLDVGTPRSTGTSRALAANGRAVEFVDAGPALDPLGPIADASQPPVFRTPTRGGPLAGAGLPDVLDPVLRDVVDAAPGEPSRSPDVPIGLPYEVVVDSGNADFVPRYNQHEGWTPERGLPRESRVPQQYLVGRDGEILTDANGLPIVVPEPTSLLAVTGAALALVGRRRRRA